VGQFETELAYLAGAIGIKRSTYAMRVRGDAGAPTFSERVALRQVTPEIPTMLKAHFGGRQHIATITLENSYGHPAACLSPDSASMS
jgi:hypothetical protein